MRYSRIELTFTKIIINNENPEILVKDKRLEELDRIVAEVKESEEWEEVEINIMEIAMERGMQEGRKVGIEQGIEQD